FVSTFDTFVDRWWTTSSGDDLDDEEVRFGVCLTASKSREHRVGAFLFTLCEGIMGWWRFEIDFTVVGSHASPVGGAGCGRWRCGWCRGPVLEGAASVVGGDARSLAIVRLWWLGVLPLLG
ncbi:hypothetical protein Dimus_036568, partial [Dionaea muscipula]